MASDWTNISINLIISIAERLVFFEDLAEFGAVCSSWQWAMREVKFVYSRPQPPWLVRVNQTQDQRTDIFSLARLRAFRLRSMPRQVYQSISIFSSRGWILSSDAYYRHFLLHPVEGTVFQLPDLECSVLKFVYTEDKSVIITGKIASPEEFRAWLWRPETRVWTTIIISPTSMDVACFTSQLIFVVVTIRELIFALIYTIAEEKSNVIGLDFSADLGEKWFAAESGDDIFFVAAEFRSAYSSFEVSGFRVFSRKVGASRSKRPERVFSLGDRTLFVGDGSASFLVKASDSARFCEPDCICFVITDGISGTYVDAGIFRMADGKILHSLRGQSPHTFWVQPTFSAT